MNLKKIIYMLIVFISCGTQSACFHISGHENFKDTMQSFVGRYESDPYIDYYFESPNYSYIGTRIILPNNNIEQQIYFSPGCPVYFVIDNISRRIISWRYKGTEEVCYIAM